MEKNTTFSIQMPMKHLVPFSLLFLLLIACESQPATSAESLPVQSVSTAVEPAPEAKVMEEVHWEAGDSVEEYTWETFESEEAIWDYSVETFPRDSILARLTAKVENKETLFVHLMVPLCDNENQGIVPVPASIGNGQNARTNLYWGAGYGIRNFFDKKVAAWQLVAESQVPENPKILERLLFYRKMENGTEVCVVADAYDGAEMAACVEDFLWALAGKTNAYWTLPAAEGATATQIPMNGGADLVIFNGHNGLMDGSADLVKNVDHRTKDAMVIACVSYSYFEPYLDAAGGYPLLTTTNLLAPEAYVVEAAISEWARLKPGADIHHAAGVAYDKYHKCGLRAAKNTFQTGWK